MRLKRVGPSIIPTEVIVPLAEMPAVLGEIDDKIDQPFILEGMVGRGDKVVLLGFIPHDERSLRLQRGVRALAVGDQDRQGPQGGGVLHRPVLPPRGRKRARCRAPRQVACVQGEGRPEGHPQSRQGPRLRRHARLHHGYGVDVRGHRAADSELVQGAERPRRSEQGRQRGARRRRLHGVRLRTLRLLRAHVRAVHRPRVGEPLAARQVRLPARGHGRSRGVEPKGDRHVPGLHDLRGVQHALPAPASHRAQLDGDARQADQRGEARHVPAVRDDGRFASWRARHLGRQGREPRRVGPCRRRREDPGAAPTSSTSPAARRASSRPTSPRPPSACCRTPGTRWATWARTRRAAASR